jgi:taurine dioxygenase
MSTATATRVRIERVTPAVGALVHGVDLSQPQDDETIAAIRRAIVDHGVVFFRDQHLDAQQYEDFAARFGEPTLPSSGIIPKLPGARWIAEVRKEEGRARNVGGSWHTDQVYRPDPSWGTMLLCRQLPPTGGDTLFLSMAAVLERLSPGLQKTLESLRAVHSNANVQARMQTGREPDPEVVHPVVIRHPESGRKILYVSPSYTQRFEGWTEEESRPLLQHLYQFAQHPEFFLRWKWQEGSLAFWDNYQTWHFAVNDYAPGERLMHRIVVNGPPFER